MSQARALLLLLLLTIPSALFAGAWPRTEGETFLSYSAEIDPDTLYDSPISVYYERGLRRNITIGFDGGGRQTDLTKAIAYLRWPLKLHTEKAVTAFELGVGFADDSFAVRPALAWGKGVDFLGRSGWISADMRGLIYDRGDALLETDFTVGLKPGKRSMIILQVQSGIPTGSDPYARLAPSFVYKVKPGRHIELGATTGLINDDDLRIKLGMWLQF